MDMPHISGQLIGLIVPVVAIVGWVAYAIVSSINRSRVRELEVRERIMMIEKGLVPPPEVDPRGFEQRMARLDRPLMYDVQYRAYRRRRSGFTLIAVGVGLDVLMFPNFRVGGFLIVLGLFFVIASLFEPAVPPPPPGPPAPPQQQQPNP